MRFEKRYAILGGTLSVLAALDLIVLVSTHFPTSGAAPVMAFVIVPAQLTLLAWWTTFGFTSLPSRIAGLLLAGTLLGLVMFRAHLNFPGASPFASAIFSIWVVGTHLALSTCGFLVGRFSLGLRLISYAFDMPARTAGFQFGLREMLVWIAGAAVVALLARYAFAGCDWEVTPLDGARVFAFALQFSFLALLASPVALVVVSLIELEQLRLRLLALYFVLVCLAEMMAITVFFPNPFAELPLCDCCGTIFFNAFQLLPIVFVFWLLRLSDYRLA